MGKEDGIGQPRRSSLLVILVLQTTAISRSSRHSSIMSSTVREVSVNTMCIGPRQILVAVALGTVLLAALVWCVRCSSPKRCLCIISTDMLSCFPFMRPFNPHNIVPGKKFIFASFCRSSGEVEEAPVVTEFKSAGDGTRVSMYRDGDSPPTEQV